MNFIKEYQNAIKYCEQWLDFVPETRIVKDQSSPRYGQMVDFKMLATLIEVSTVNLGISVYYCKDSKYYKSKKILDCIESTSYAGIDKLNDDGTYDMPETNFRTGDQFGLSHVAEALRVMNMYVSDDPDERRAHNAVCRFCEKLALGCLNSGFHTPNHRWVESAGLLQAAFALEQAGFSTYVGMMRQKAARYIAEGIDCDEEGEWSERSAGMYNAHCDRYVLSMYRMTGNEEFYDAVYRNLMLMRYYIGNDFAMFTQNSRRTDKGEVGSRPMFFKATTYYASVYEIDYVVAAYLRKDALLASVADEIIDHANCNLPLSPFLLYPDMKDWEFEKVDEPIPHKYEKYQPKSHIVRKRNDSAIYSFLARNPSFLQIEAPGIHLQARMCSSFFAVAQFIPKTMEKTERGYKLSMTAHGEYKLPLDNPDGITTKDYWSIDFSARRAIQQIDLDMSVEAVFTDDGVDLYFSAQGYPNVPTKIEFFVNPGLHCEIGDTVLITTAGANVFARSGAARFESNAGYVMTVDGLFCKHLYAEGMRGSLDPISDAFVLYATEYSPIERKISIKFNRADGARIF